MKKIKFGWITLLILTTLLVAGGCQKKNSEVETTETSSIVETTETTEATTAPPTESTEAVFIPYGEREKIALATPQDLSLYMTLESLIEIYGDPLDSFYFTGSLVYEFKDFFAFTNGPYVDDASDLHADETFLVGVWFKLTDPIYELYLGMPLTEIEIAYGPLEVLTRSTLSEFHTGYNSVLTIDNIQIDLMFDEAFKISSIYVREVLPDLGPPIDASGDRIKFQVDLTTAYASFLTDLKSKNATDIALTEKGIYYNLSDSSQDENSGFYFLNAQTEKVIKLSSQSMLLLDDALNQVLTQNAKDGMLTIIDPLTSKETQVSKFGYLDFYGVRSADGVYFTRLK